MRHLTLDKEDEMLRLVMALGFSALLAVPVAAATVYDANATSTISIRTADPGLRFTYSGTLDLGAFASGGFGATAGANFSGDMIPDTISPFDPLSSLTFGLLVEGQTPSNPNLDTTAASFYDRSVTFTISNTTNMQLGATFSIFYSLFASVQSDGLLGETSLARATFSILGDALPNSTVILSRGLPVTVAGDEDGTATQTFDSSFFVEGGQSATLTIALSADGNAAASAVAPVPLPASAPLLSAALVGLGALLRRRRAANA
jgi:hypothetical protein